MLRPPTPGCSSVFTKNISFNFFRRQPACCDEDKPIEPTPKYIIQKSCCPSIFDSWKPKKPDLNACNYPTIKASMMMPYKHKTCAAGMKIRESRCDIEARARECQKMNHPKWVKKCPPKPKGYIVGPLPPLKAAAMKCKGAKSEGKDASKTPSKSLRKKCEPPVPKGDWDIDGRLS